MDGYLFRDEDIIGNNPGEYKPFDLVDWKVSLESLELNFTTENLLARVQKQDNTLEDPDSWLSVWNTKESWSETKTKSTQEGYLNEQVVPDQCQTVYQLNHKTNGVPIQETQSNLAELSKHLNTEENNCDLTKISNDVIMNNELEGVGTAENHNNSMFIVNHKEQVKCEQEHFKIPPANILFTFNPLCKERNVENVAENRINEIPTESATITAGPDLSSSSQAIEVSEKDSELKIQRSQCSASESLQPAYVEKTLKIKLNKYNFGQQSGKHTLEETDILKIRKGVFKLLTVNEIPKCIMVDYKFHCNDKLPSFAETFCPNLSEGQIKTLGDVELPDVLQNLDEKGDKDEEMSIVLPDSDSDCESSEPDIEQDEGLESELIYQESASAAYELPKIKSEVLNTESETFNNTQKTEKVETPSSMLAIDDELEKYLVSSIVLNDTTESNDSHLPDLSNNIGLILKSEGLNEEHCIESVYGSLFLKPELQVDGIRPCKEEQNTDLNVSETFGNYQGDLFDAALLGNERSWQEQNAQDNPLYGNLWTNSAPGYVNQIGSRHFSNIFRMGDPFMNNTDLNTMAGLPVEIMQTDTDHFKFTNLVPKVEVLDSSLNYGF